MYKLLLIIALILLWFFFLEKRGVREFFLSHEPSQCNGVSPCGRYGSLSKYPSEPTATDVKNVVDSTMSLINNFTSNKDTFLREISAAKSALDVHNTDLQKTDADIRKYKGNMKNLTTTETIMKHLAETNDANIQSMRTQTKKTFDDIITPDITNKLVNDSFIELRKSVSENVENIVREKIPQKYSYSNTISDSPKCVKIDDIDYIVKIGKEDGGKISYLRDACANKDNAVNFTKCDSVSDDSSTCNKLARRYYNENNFNYDSCPIGWTLTDYDERKCSPPTTTNINTVCSDNTLNTSGDPIIDNNTNSCSFMKLGKQDKIDWSIKHNIPFPPKVDLLSIARKVTKLNDEVNNEFSGRFGEDGVDRLGNYKHHTNGVHLSVTNSDGTIIYFKTETPSINFNSLDQILDHDTFGISRADNLLYKFNGYIKVPQCTTNITIYLNTDIVNLVSLTVNGVQSRDKTVVLTINDRLKVGMYIPFELIVKNHESVKLQWRIDESDYVIISQEYLYTRDMNAVR
jgi:hypothetical protein